MNIEREIALRREAFISDRTSFERDWKHFFEEFNKNDTDLIAQLPTQPNNDCKLAFPSLYTEYPDERVHHAEILAVSPFFIAYEKLCKELHEKAVETLGTVDIDKKLASNRDRFITQRAFIEKEWNLFFQEFTELDSSLVSQLPSPPDSTCNIALPSLFADIPDVTMYELELVPVLKFFHEYNSLKQRLESEARAQLRECDVK